MDCVVDFETINLLEDSLVIRQKGPGLLRELVDLLLGLASCRGLILADFEDGLQRLIGTCDGGGSQKGRQQNHRSDLYVFQSMLIHG